EGHLLAGRDGDGAGVVDLADDVDVLLGELEDDEGDLGFDENALVFVELRDVADGFVNREAGELRRFVEVGQAGGAVALDADIVGGVRGAGYLEVDEVGGVEDVIGRDGGGGVGRSGSCRGRDGDSNGLGGRRANRAGNEDENRTGGGGKEPAGGFHGG